MKYSLQSYRQFHQLPPLHEAFDRGVPRGDAWHPSAEESEVFAEYQAERGLLREAGVGQ